MDRQYLQIQQLRKRLFFWDKDDADHECELDIRHGDSTRQLCGMWTSLNWGLLGSERHEVYYSSVLVTYRYNEVVTGMFAS